MKLPIRPVTMPTALRHTLNGKLLSKDLTTVPGLAGGADIRLIAPAARAYAAMQAAASTAGHTFKIGSANSAYRPHSDQERIFRDRYYIHILGTRRWQGKRWRKRPGVAAAAVPGTSNHGWALAVDLGSELDGDDGTESISNAAVAWLVGNAHLYGFSAELQSEPWHWFYYAGDATPAAVLLYEQVTEEDTMILLHDTDSDTWRVAVPGEGSAVIDSPAHWFGVIGKGRKTGVYASPYVSDLIGKIRKERKAS